MDVSGEAPSSTETSKDDASPAAGSVAYIAGKFVVSLVSKYMPKSGALNVSPGAVGSSVDHDVSDVPTTPNQVDEYDESSGYEDTPSDFSPSSATPDETESRLMEDRDGELSGDQTEGVLEPKACVLS